MSNQYFGDDRIVHESIDISKASSHRIYSDSESPDDIVTRLRAYDIGDIARESCYHMTEVLGEAADEIERLRADRDNCKDLASEYYHLDPKCECHLCDRFREAIRDAKQ